MCVHLEEIETTVGVIVGVVEEELATIATKKDIWQEIVPKATAEKEAVVEEVDLEEAEVVVVVVVAGLATIATKKATWQGNAPKETVEIVEAKKQQV